MWIFFSTVKQYFIWKMIYFRDRTETEKVFVWKLSGIYAAKTIPAAHTSLYLIVNGYSELYHIKLLPKKSSLYCFKLLGGIKLTWTAAFPQNQILVTISCKLTYFDIKHHFDAYCTCHACCLPDSTILDEDILRQLWHFNAYLSPTTLHWFK